jgi:hypothetical protein
MATYLQYALWEDLPPEVRSLFAGFTGKGLAAGKSLYELYFYGYNIPHEVSHILRAVTQTRTERQWDEETSCNRFAVAFWRGRGAVGLLRQLEESLSACLARLADPCPPGEDRADYFNRHYQELSDPPSYAHYQFNMVLSALAQPLSFAQALQMFFNHTAPDPARLPFLGDPRTTPELPARTLSEIRAALEAFGLPLPEVTLQRLYTPAIQRVVG